MSQPPKVDPQEQARILSEALPHMQQYDEEIVVVKYGGHAMGDEQTARDFARDIVLLEQAAINPVVVHGGGPQIASMLKKLNIKSEFAGGLRVTDAATVEIVEMVLAGSINKQIVGYINAAGGKAIGLCGKDGNMVQAKKVTRTVVDPDSNIEKVVDLGFVGEPDKVDLTVLNHVLGKEMIPVLAPVASAADGGTFNVNADTFAGAIAGALKAKRLLLLTDVPGVLDKSKNLITDLSVADARKLIADGTISQAFPFDKIKIDGSFIKSVHENGQAATIVRAVLGLGRGLNLPVLAEGVETIPELEFLAQENCDEVQGYLLGRPNDIAEFANITGVNADTTVKSKVPGVEAAVPKLRVVG